MRSWREAASFAVPSGSANDMKLTCTQVCQICIECSQKERDIKCTQNKEFLESLCSMCIHVQVMFILNMQPPPPFSLLCLWKMGT